MDNIFADRINDVPRSFIREILKVAQDPTVISFAGGLPNKDLFPVDALNIATAKVFDRDGKAVLQYSQSEGYLPLREFIAQRYKDSQGLNINVEDILITSGSQQGLDLLGKIYINGGDGLVIESPGYLGAIQAFSIYQPKFLPVSVSEGGMDTTQLKSTMDNHSPKLVYMVPNFQNPSGISYPNANREKVAKIIADTNAIIIEDNPYGDLRFSGEHQQSFMHYLPEQTILLGSFSKTVVPGFRLGWVVAPPVVMEKLITAKQATDLHTTYFTQSIMHQYLVDNDINEHINLICDVYGKQCHAMSDAVNQYFPSEVKVVQPEGGMFLWASLPEGVDSSALCKEAIKEKVLFVPGDPFYINTTSTHTMRLSFSCVNKIVINEGMKRLGNVIKKHLAQHV
jgi:2-aminoadipate transaminase